MWKSLCGVVMAVGLTACGGGSDTEDKLAETESQLAETESQLADIQSELEVALDRVSELETSEQARLNEENALPNVLAVFDAHLQPCFHNSVHFVSWEGDETYVDFGANNYSGRTDNCVSYWDELTEIFSELGINASIMSRIGQTTALDGTLEAEGDGVTATWSYHPDNGLNLVVSR